MGVGIGQPRVAVVVVTYNGARLVERCLASLAGEATPLRLVVVDNASDDGTPALVRERFPQADVIACASNEGFGSGNNRGIEHALALGCDYTFLLNQDAWIAPGALDLLVRTLDQRPEFGAASPLHCTADLQQLDPKTTTHYLRPHAMAFLADAALRRVGEVYPVHGMNAAAWLVRCGTWRRCGGFDPLFFMYGEDDDLLARWQRHGIGFALVPAACIGHARAPAGPSRRPVSALRLRAQRLRSRLVFDLKQMRSEGHDGVRTIIGGGVAEALAEWLQKRDARGLAAGLLACWQTWRQRHVIVRHAELCQQSGPHFLASGAPTAGTPD